MSFNILHDNGWDRRKALVVSAIEGERPDVLGLQEAFVWQLEYLVDALPEYAYSGAGRDDGHRGGESVGILYRKDRFELAASGTFWFSDRPEVPGSVPGEDWGSPTLPRICSWVRLVEKSTGRGIYVYNVHLQHNAGGDSDLARTASVELLRTRIANREPADPVIVTGDFNSTETEVPIRRMIDTGHDEPFVDTYRVLHVGAAAGTRCFEDDDAGRRIDYVFAGKGSDVLQARIGKKQDGACASDHRYVFALVDPWR